jgi:hypothetical protein
MNSFKLYKKKLRDVKPNYVQQIIILLILVSFIRHSVIDVNQNLLQFRLK